MGRKVCRRRTMRSVLWRVSEVFRRFLAEIRFVFEYFLQIAGNRSYVVQVHSHTEFGFTIGEAAESRVVEMYSDFVVNGVRGHGVAEWQYRNLKNQDS